MIVNSVNTTRFTAPCWITNGGGVLTADSNPNSVAPAASRVISNPIQTISDPFSVGSGADLVVQLASPTSCNVRFWWYDDGQNLWLPLGSTFGLSYAGNSDLVFSGVAHSGTKFFVQLTSIVNVTAAAFFFR